MPAHNKTAFVTWYPYGTRATEFSKAVGSRALFTKHLIRSRGWKWKLFFWIDYVYKAFQTVAFLTANRPELVIATSPPSICVLVCGAWCQLTRTFLVVDAHNSAFARPWISVPFYKRILSWAKCVIVHNDEYAAFLKRKYPDIRFHVLHDPIPDFSHVKREPSDGRNYMLVVLSYNSDEPVSEILNAIKSHLERNDKTLIFELTGNFEKRPDLVEIYGDIPKIHFLGFISRERYERMLINAYGVISLTTMPMVQQCAVMEAIGASVPALSSDTETNKRILYQGAVLANPESRSIEKALGLFIQNHSRLSREVRSLREYWIKKWEDDFETFRNNCCLKEYVPRTNARC